MIDLSTMLTTPHKDVCPGCGRDLDHGVCCMTYTKWRCWGCGATIDSRVSMPKVVYLNAETGEWEDTETFVARLESQ